MPIRPHERALDVPALYAWSTEDAHMCGLPGLLAAV
jgi:hypothetical protein